VIWDIATAACVTARLTRFTSYARSLFFIVKKKPNSCYFSNPSTTTLTTNTSPFCLLWQDRFVPLGLFWL